MVTHGESFEEFLRRCEAASEEFINGPDALLALSTRNEPATFFPPTGARMRGAATINAANERSAAMFGSGASGRFDVYQSGSCGKPLKMELRTTEVFRREEGEWKLIHRHADTIEPPK